MDPTEALLISGSKKIIENTFLSVFERISGRAKAWLELRKLTSKGAEKYADYMCRRIGTFPLFATTLTANIDKTYVKVSISKRPDRELYRGKEHIVSDLLRQKMGDQPISTPNSLAPLEALNKSEGLFALLGSPGSGKTTAFKHIALEAAKGTEFRAAPRLPIFIAVREMEEGRSIVGAAEQFLKWIEVDEAERVLKALLLSGHCIFFIDGLDETKSENQIRLLNELTELHFKYHKSIFCVSARPHSLSAGLAGATKWETVPLSFEDRLEFSTKWFDVVDPKKGANFYNACASTPGLLDLGSNPLLLSIVCALYFNELNIPSEPTELYARSVEGMLGGWDNFRNIVRQSTLGHMSIQRRAILVAAIAENFFQTRNLVFTRNNLEESGVLQKIGEHFGLPIPEPEIVLNAYANDFGVLSERSPGLFSFSHLTLHEYLVAKHIVDNREEMGLLSSHLSDPGWSEVIALTGKLLPDASSYLRYIFDRIRPDFGGSISTAARVVSLRPNCSRATRNYAMHELSKKLATIGKMVGGEFRRTGDKIVVTYGEQTRVPPLIAAARNAKKLSEENSVDRWTPIEMDKDSSGARAAKKDRLRKKEAHRRRNTLNLFGYLDEINSIFHNMNFLPHEEGIKSSFLEAISGPPPTNGFSLEVEVLTRGK